MKKISIAMIVCLLAFYALVTCAFADDGIATTNISFDPQNGDIAIVGHDSYTEYSQNGETYKTSGRCLIQQSNTDTITNCSIRISGEKVKVFFGGINSSGGIYDSSSSFEIVLSGTNTIEHFESTGKVTIKSSESGTLRTHGASFNVLIMESGVFKCSGGRFNYIENNFDDNRDLSAREVTVNGGTIITNFLHVQNDNYGKLIINDGSVSIETAYLGNSSWLLERGRNKGPALVADEMTMNGGRLSVRQGYSLDSAVRCNRLTINDGTVDIEGTCCGIQVEKDSILEINGGTVNASAYGRIGWTNNWKHSGGNGIGGRSSDYITQGWAGDEVGTIIINGGVVTATGGIYYSGIEGRDISILGGTVTAQSTYYSSGEGYQAKVSGMEGDTVIIKDAKVNITYKYNWDNSTMFGVGLNANSVEIERSVMSFTLKGWRGFPISAYQIAIDEESLSTIEGNIYQKVDMTIKNDALALPRSNVVFNLMYTAYDDIQSIRWQRCDTDYSVAFSGSSWTDLDIEETVLSQSFPEKKIMNIRCVIKTFWGNEVYSDVASAYPLGFDSISNDKTITHDDMISIQASPLFSSKYSDENVAISWQKSITNGYSWEELSGQESSGLTILPESDERSALFRCVLTTPSGLISYSAPISVVFSDSEDQLLCFESPDDGIVYFVAYDKDGRFINVVTQSIIQGETYKGIAYEINDYSYKAFLLSPEILPLMVPVTTGT